MTAMRQETIGKTKVFLSDPQVLFREGIHFILSGEDDFEVIGETTSNEEAYNAMIANPPRVAVLGMQDAKISGPDITRRLKRNIPSLAVILSMSVKETGQLFAAIKSGASACITKDTDPDFLLNIIRVVAQGSSPIMEEMLSPELAALAIEEFKDITALNEQVDHLLALPTTVESQLLATIAAGNNLEQIEARLSMTEDTVRHHLRYITSKLVSNEQSRTLVEAGQRSVTPIFRTAAMPSPNKESYVTKAEFNEFKEQFTERLKSLLGELR